MIVFNILKIISVIVFCLNGISVDDYFLLELLEVIEGILMIGGKLATKALSTKTSKILIIPEKSETLKISEKSEDLEKVE